ncbi:ATP-dependent nuclease [Pleionea sediminis]|uniref:ATP-dependent nuclease n=1 Tax=Pleionea sediminis TaxID=2569479 RepID=UPI00118585A6|nr:AAA family ATPase [Pleionea sediminis]
MKIKSCNVKNFKGLENIELKFDNNVCLIAGPNAIGKSTVLDAIRLIRATLLSRYPSEGQSVLHTLGAASNPNQMMMRSGYFDFSAIARNPRESLIIRVAVVLEESEISKINSSIQSLALDYLRGSIGNQIQQEQGALTQFLSSSEGRSQLAKSEAIIATYIQGLKEREVVQLGMEILPDGQIRGDDAAAQIVCGFLERSLPPQKGLFSFFSADRALPSGEAAIQLGANDADNQMKSHIAEPNLKYQRLKISIANSKLLEEDIETDFKTIFDEILPGKELGKLQIGPIGNFRVSIKESQTTRPFDIDSLSSGEKGLILTFLLIRRAVHDGGVILIDEPELHLNPGVCRKLLRFIIDHCIKPKNLQAIICTHSAEILNSAYESFECDIHHLKSPNNATPIYRGDFNEMFDALGKLGVSPAESFFYETRLFVEGPHDKEVLEEGFRSVLGDRCQISYLGGRKSVEAEIENLKNAEKSGSLDKLHCFIFDRDRNVTNLKSSKLVKVIQWNRYCLENFLINSKLLYDLLGREKKEKSLPDRGEFDNLIKKFALQQIIPIASRRAYEQFRPTSPGLDNEDLNEKYEDMAGILFKKLESLKTDLVKMDLENWEEKYIEACKEKDKELSKSWGGKWISECNGKDVLDKLFNYYSVKCSRIELKKSLMRLMKEKESSEWKEIQKLLIKNVLHDRGS